jgi:uncharacterized protein YrzB (UPF0473 family)
MNKKMLLPSILTIITIVAITVWLSGTNLNPLKDKNTDDIVEIIFSNPTNYYTITEQEDIETLFEVLKSMNLSRKLNNSIKDGFAFLIEIKFESGETVEMSILSKVIRMNNHNYKSDEDYLNSIREIFNTFSEKYENNPA